MQHITVKKLIDFLQHHDPNNIVVIGTGRKKDGLIVKGSPLQGLASNMMYKGGEIGLRELTQEDEAYDCTEDDVMVDGIPAIILMSEKV